jgi:threonine dehydratase
MSSVVREPSELSCVPRLLIPYWFPLEGGLAAGIGLSFADSSTRVIGVQLQNIDVMRRLLLQQPVANHLPSSVADGVVVREPGRLSTQLCRCYLDDIVVVTETEVIETMVVLSQKHKIIVEGAGALAVAAMSKVPGEKKIAVVSGGNIDLARFAELVRQREACWVA